MYAACFLFLLFLFTIFTLLTICNPSTAYNYTQFYKISHTYFKIFLVVTCFVTSFVHILNLAWSDNGLNEEPKPVTKKYLVLLFMTVVAVYVNMNCKEWKLIA